MSIRKLSIPTAQIKSFVVTGKLYNSNKRFKNTYESYIQAMMINLWSGSVWALLDNGKRKLIKRVN